MTFPNYCSNCGDKIPDKYAEVCPSCGAIIKNASFQRYLFYLLVVFACISAFFYGILFFVI